MDIPFCYSLVDGAEGKYSRMARVSIALLRRVYPEAQIVLMVDQSTARGMKERGEPLLSEVHEVREVDVSGNGGAAFRSRFVKTMAPQIVRGPLVMLDVDALPLRRLDRLVKSRADLTGVVDRVPTIPVDHFTEGWVAQIYQQMGWGTVERPYFSSGVLKLGDSAPAWRLRREWHEIWRQCSEVTGDHQDQPALNAAIQRSRVRVKNLPLSYNAVVDAAPCYGRGARVMHFSPNQPGGGRGESLMSYLVRQLEETGRIDWLQVEKARRCGSPWIPPAEEMTGRTFRRPEEQYDHWARKALQTGDFEAAWKLFCARMRIKPLSRAGLRLGGVFVQKMVAGASGKKREAKA
jgi:hypothetical protein